MLRLNRTDFEDPHELAKYAATCGISLEEFQKQFYYLMQNDLLYKNLDENKISLAAVETNEIYKPKNQPVTKNDDDNHDGMML
jgi:6-phosphofructokinase 1